MDKHVIEALGKARVTVQDGKVVDVGEPKIEYCPLFHKHRGIEKLTEEEIKKNIGKPDYIKEIKGQKNVEIWVYTNNAELTIEKGKVSNINLNRE